MKYNVTFHDIKITYWFAKDTLCIDGEAYFVQDDMVADITNGYFKHPVFNKEYQLTPHSPFNEDCILSVKSWRQIGRALPERIGS